MGREPGSSISCQDSRFASAPLRRPALRAGPLTDRAAWLRVALASRSRKLFCIDSAGGGRAEGDCISGHEALRPRRRDATVVYIARCYHAAPPRPFDGPFPLAGGRPAGASDWLHSGPVLARAQGRARQGLPRSSEGHTVVCLKSCRAPRSSRTAKASPQAAPWARGRTRPTPKPMPCTGTQYDLLCNDNDRIIPISNVYHFIARRHRKSIARTFCHKKFIA